MAVPAGGGVLRCLVAQIRIGRAGSRTTYQRAECESTPKSECRAASSEELSKDSKFGIFPLQVRPKPQMQGPKVRTDQNSTKLDSVPALPVYEAGSGVTPCFDEANRAWTTA